jgi:aryl-alcohol dehydrogenase-like predicted oxidoreductase
VREDQFREAERITPIVSVQNRYNVNDRTSEQMVDLCSQEDLVFLPWAPIQETQQIIPVVTTAERHGVNQRQIALAWLLARSPVILPIPGSGSPEHVAENVAAASIQLLDEEYNEITDAVQAAQSS